MRSRLFTSIISYLSSSFFLITDPPEPTKASNPPPPGLVVPLDENIALLAAAGLILGVTFVQKRR